MRRTVLPLAAGDGFTLEQLTVRSDDPAWSATEVVMDYRLVLVRSGVFEARVGTRELLADPAAAYLGAPADEHSIAHRVGAQNTYTALRLSDPFELAELTARLVGGLFATPTPARYADGRSATAIARRRLVEAARELLTLDPTALDLREVARQVGCSPHHLSRIFHQHTGMTLTRYRNRVRVLRALEALAQGHRDLAGLAAELGFADHAHLTLTVRRECGRSPRALRRLLAERD